MINLVEDWDKILLKAWSVKFNIAAAIFGGLEVAVAMVQPGAAVSPGAVPADAFAANIAVLLAAVPSGVFAGVAVFISIAANVARILAQKELSGGTTATTTQPPQ